MNYIFLLILPVLAFSQKNRGEIEALPPVNKYPRLELIEHKQFEVKMRNFDLSGIAKFKDKVIAVNDKNDANIYQVNWSEGTITAVKKLDTKDALDIEAIDACDDIIYVSNEKNNDIYKLLPDGKTIEVQPNYKKFKIYKTIFDVNTFYEGIAMDCKNQIMYMTKERQERHILNYNLKTKEITDNWNIPETDSWDFSDAKYENGYLYVLERGNHLVTKIKLANKTVVSKVSYQNFEKSPGYLFGPALFTQGEALLLTDDEIWIGFDNNGRRATHLSKRDLGLDGKNPLIAKFKRPKGF